MGAATKKPNLATARIRARRVALDAIAQGAAIHANPRISRSTRTRSAYKHKATALDQVARILCGKE